MKNHVSAITFGIAIIVASLFLGRAYVERSKPDGEIQVTGLGETNFTSDLIVWEGRFSAENPTLRGAYATLEKDKQITREYLEEKGVDPSNIVFKAVEMIELTRTKYNDEGNYAGEEFIGYRLFQTLEIESKEVEKIEKISREITELLNKGVQFYSQSPRYYLTQLKDLKIEMISRATEDARIRAEKIAENAGGTLGELHSAKMGVFQITGQNSKEDYSWGGTFNTSSKEKTASITMRLVYKVK